MSDQQNKIASTMHLPFDGGMDQRTHPRQTQAPAVLEAANVRYNLNGGVEKRPGIRQVAGGFKDGYTLVVGQGKLIGFGDELIAADKFRFGSRAVAGNAGIDYFTNKGKIPEATSKLKNIPSTQYTVLDPDVGSTSDGLVIHAWLGGAAGTQAVVDPAIKTNGIFATVEDVITGTIISASFQLTDHSFNWWNPQVVVRGGLDVYVMWASNPRGTHTGVMYRKWNRSTLSWDATVTIATPASVTTFVAAANSTYVYILTTAGPGVTLYVYDFTMALVFTNLMSSSTNVLGYGIAVNDATLWGLYVINDNANPRSVWGFTANVNNGVLVAGPFLIYTDTGVPGFTFFPPQTTAAILPGGGALVCMKFLDTMYCPVLNASGAVVGNASPANRKTYWQAPASKPFVDSTSPLRCYMFVYAGGAGNGSNPLGPDGTSVGGTPAQYTHMLVDLLADNTASVAWAPRPITWQAPRFAVPGFGNQIDLGAPCSVAQYGYGSGKYIADAIIIRNNNGRTSLAEHIADFTGKDRMMSCQLGQTMIVTPGFFYDKGIMAEVSFAYSPHTPGLTKTLSGGSMPDGTFLYKVIYEFVDANGFVHQSLPSDTTQVVISGGSGAAQVKISVPCLCITARNQPGAFDGGVRIVVYRQDVSAGTGQFLRLFIQGADPLNDSTKASIDIVDGAASLSQAEELYTDSGVFPNVMPSSFTSCVTYRNRVWVAYGHTINYSKAFVTGSTINFTDAFELPLEETGDITAMWVMDDALYIATTDRIYYLQADGPNDFGQQSDVNTPNRVAADFGCIEQRSVVVTQVGALFQSRTGLNLLTRNRTIASEPVGARVQKDLAAFPSIVSAALHPAGRIVTLVCVSAVGTGIRLVYDYATDRWSRDTMRTDNIQAGLQMFSESVAGSVLYTMFGDASNLTVVCAEDPTTNLDTGIWVNMGITMGEVHPGGLQGNMSFAKWTVNHERLAEYNVTASWFRNYETTPYLTKPLTDAEILAMPADQFSFNTSVHRAQSMRMSLVDGRPTTVTTGKGARWIGLAVELDPIDNKTFRLATAQKR